MNLNNKSWCHQFFATPFPFFFFFFLGGGGGGGGILRHLARPIWSSKFLDLWPICND